MIRATLGAVLVGDLAGDVGDVGLHPHDGLDAGLGRLLVEVEGPIHIAVVGDGDGAHAELGGALDQILHPDRAVEKRVLGVQMQMSKISAAHVASVKAVVIAVGKDGHLRNRAATTQAAW